MRMMSDVPACIAGLVKLQCGIITADQAQAAGLSRGILRSRVRHGRWQRIQRGVYATFSGELSRAAIMWAAVLGAGPGAMLSHRSAAEMDKLTDERSALVHVTIPAERRAVPRPGVVLHRSRRAAEAAHPAQTPPRTRIEETILDLAEAATTVDDMAGWVTKGLGRRLTTREKLAAAARRRPLSHWRRELAELLSDDMAGVHSALEFRYVRDVERPHGLPAAARQLRFRDQGRSGYRDVLYDEYGVAIELDGRIAHPAESRWRDIRRDNAAAADGITTLRFGWLDITSDPCAVAAQITRALRQRGYPSGRPCRPGCPVGRAERSA
jgi:very-short-patch-repair endonuclease